MARHMGKAAKGMHKKVRLMPSSFTLKKGMARKGGRGRAKSRY
jgi:hypothetical protein